MDDIEDILSKTTLQIDPSPVSASTSDAQLHLLEKENLRNKYSTKKETGIIPGNEKVYLETFGCAHNVSDGEYMKGLLASYGYELVNLKEKDNADVWVVNSCTVKDPSQATFMNLVRKGKENNKAVVVAGCVPQADRNLKGLEDVSMVGVNNIDQIVYAVEESAKGNTVRLLTKSAKTGEKPRLDLPKVRKNKLVEIIPISTGCLGSCTYCKTKHARGKLGSYTLEQLTSRVRSVLDEEDIREVWLASEDTGAYGRDIGTDIGKLLRLIVREFETYHNRALKILPEESKEELNEIQLSSLPIRKMLKVGMTNPPYILAHLDVISDVLNHPNVFKFIHLPVQSGSNYILGKMRREYTVQEFRRICDFLLKYVPGISIATDIICGFPGETEEHFQETLDLINHYKFPVVNISKFYARPGTPAAKMVKTEGVDTRVSKDRSRRLTKLFESYQVYDNYLNKVARVWFTEEVFRQGTSNAQSVGHTIEYVKVCVPFQQSLVGSSRMVKITQTQKFHVSGVIIQADVNP